MHLPRAQVRRLIGALCIPREELDRTQSLLQFLLIKQSWCFLMLVISLLLGSTPLVILELDPISTSLQPAGFITGETLQEEEKGLLPGSVRVSMFSLLQCLVGVWDPQRPSPLASFSSSFQSLGPPAGFPDNSKAPLQVVSWRVLLVPQLNSRPWLVSQLLWGKLPGSPVYQKLLGLQWGTATSSPTRLESQPRVHGWGQGRLFQICSFHGHSVSALGTASTVPVSAISVFFSS